jgi:arylsulfatase A-like enzyme
MLKALGIGLCSGVSFGFGFLIIEILVNPLIMRGWHISIKEFSIWSLFYLILCGATGIVTGLWTFFANKWIRGRVTKGRQYTYSFWALLILAIVYCVGCKFGILWYVSLISGLILITVGIRLSPFIIRKRDDWFAIGYSVYISLVLFLIVSLKINERILGDIFSKNSIVWNSVVLICFAMLGILLYWLVLMTYRIRQKIINFINIKTGIVGVCIVMLCSLFLYYSIIWEKGRSEDVEAAKNGMPNIIIIVADALRADHLSCYGYKRDTTPNIDELAKEGALFKTCIAQSSWTRPSVASLFTSLYPSMHLAYTVNQRLPEYLTTMAEVLKGKGYTTCGISANLILKEEFGYSQGFDYYNVETQESIYACFCSKRKDLLFGMLGEWLFKRMFKPYDAVEIDCDLLTQKALNWIEKKGGSPFFLYLHYMDPHAPYNPPESYERMYSEDYKGKKYRMGEVIRLKKMGREISPKELQNIIDRYDGEITFMDEYIGKLINALKEMQLFENTLLVFTADHGEAFFEHNDTTHGQSLYNELIHVPLIITYPKLIKRNTVIDTPVAMIDIMPTIMEVLNIPCFNEMQGKSFLTLFQDEDPIKHKEFIISELFVQRGKGGWCTAIITKDYKYILIENSLNNILGSKKLAHKKLQEFYDLRNDPKELYNIFCPKSEAVGKLKKKLLVYLSFKRQHIHSPEEVEIDEDTKQQLKALGYM